MLTPYGHHWTPSREDYFNANLDDFLFDVDLADLQIDDELRHPPTDAEIAKFWAECDAHEKQLHAMGYTLPDLTADELGIFEEEPFAPYVSPLNEWQARPKKERLAQLSKFYADVHGDNGEESYFDRFDEPCTLAEFVHAVEQTS